MSNQKSLLLLLVTSSVTLILIYGHLAKGQRQFSRDARSAVIRACGKKLSQVISVVCQGRYVDIFDGDDPDSPSKRTSSKMDDEYQLSNDEDSRKEYKDLDYPVLAFFRLSVNEFPIIRKPKALSIISDENFWRRRRGPGVVDECCLNSCTLEQLKRYCA